MSIFIKTGMKVECIDENNNKMSFKASVKGDVNGDGYITLTDQLAVNEVYLEFSNFDSYPMFLAADVVEDDTINLQDALDIQEYYLEFKTSLNN